MPAKVIYDQAVKGDLRGQVEPMDVRERKLEHCHRPQGVEEDLESAEEGLSCDAVQEYGLEPGRKISVESFDTEGLVVDQVVGLHTLLAVYCGYRTK